MTSFICSLFAQIYSGAKWEGNGGNLSYMSSCEFGRYWRHGLHISFYERKKEKIFLGITAYLSQCRFSFSPIGIKFSYKKTSVEVSISLLNDWRDRSTSSKHCTVPVSAPFFPFPILHLLFYIFFTCSCGRLAITFLDWSLEPDEGYFQSAVTHFPASSLCLFSINDLTLILQ